MSEETKRINYKIFFEYQGSDSAVCRMCSDDHHSKIIQRKDGNTSGLMRHLEKCHPCIFKQRFDPNIKSIVVVEKERIKKEKKRKETEIDVLKRCVQLRQKPYGETSEANIECICSFSLGVILEGLPISFTTKKDFFECIRLINKSIVPVSDDILRRLMDETIDVCFNQLAKLFKDEKRTTVSISFDDWSNKKKNKFGGSVCSVLQDYSFNQFAIGCTAYEGKTDNVAVKEKALETVHSFYPSVERIYITSDRASNNVAAFNTSKNVLDYEILFTSNEEIVWSSCIAHDLQQIESKIIQFMDLKKILKQVRNCVVVFKKEKK